MALIGTHHVLPTKGALRDAQGWWPKIRDRMEVRRQAIKLRHWGRRHEEERLIDLTFESIKAMSGSGVYELRIKDVIGGQSNIRVIFFDPPVNWATREEYTLPLILVLAALPKRRTEWTRFDLVNFRSRRLAAQEDFFST